MDISELVGKVFTKVYKSNHEYKDEIIFVCNDGKEYKMYHQQDCCENVSIESINGDLDDLVGIPILIAEERTSRELSTEQKEKEEKEKQEKGDDYYYDNDDSFTWIFYTLGTEKAYVDIRWYGSSNGYYSESVDIVEVGGNEDY